MCPVRICIINILQIEVPSGGGNLKICTSRRLNINTTNNCDSINSDGYKFSCGDAAFIHLCDPLYLKIIANSSTNLNQCTGKYKTITE